VASLSQREKALTARQEFGYGFYDGISGLITQPLRGAEKEGTAGLIKGIGKGIGGLLLKPSAGKNSRMLDYNSLALLFIEGSCYVCSHCSLDTSLMSGARYKQ
jgi:hypothetical protein